MHTVGWPGPQLCLNGQPSNPTQQPGTSRPGAGGGGWRVAAGHATAVRRHCGPQARQRQDQTSPRPAGPQALQPGPDRPHGQVRATTRPQHCATGPLGPARSSPGLWSLVRQSGGLCAGPLTRHHRPGLLPGCTRRSYRLFSVTVLPTCGTSGSTCALTGRHSCSNAHSLKPSATAGPWRSWQVCLGMATRIDQDYDRHCLPV